MRVIPVTVLLVGLVMPSMAPAAGRCVAPAELLAVPGEEKPQKGNHTFDAAEPPRSLAPFKPIGSELRGVIRRVELPKGQKLIALTLDLCEQPGEIAGYDGAIFDYLRANGIKATLFAGGKWMRSHDARTRQLMTDPLFELGNHASAHRNLRLLSEPTLTAEIIGPQSAYEAVRQNASADQCLAPQVQKTPERLELFRFPYGACNDSSLAAVNDAGLLAVQWDVSTGDPSPGTSAEEIAKSMIEGVRPGSIIIAHANGRGVHTAAGLPLAIPKLKAAGYTFVTVSELLAAGRPVMVPTCYNNKPGDTDRYDHPLGLTVSKTNPPKTPLPHTDPNDVLPWAVRPQSPQRPASRALEAQQPKWKWPWE